MARIKQKIKVEKKRSGIKAKVKPERKISGVKSIKSGKEIPKSVYTKASYYLSFMDYDDMKRNVDAIIAQSKIDGSKMIDAVLDETVTPTEENEYEFTVDSFLDEIRYKDRPTPSMATGGFISKGERVWNKLTPSKRAEFLYENFTPEITPRSQETLVDKAYNFLPKNVKIKIESKYANVEEGQYASGGSMETGEKGGQYQVKEVGKRFFVIYKFSDGEEMIMSHPYKTESGAEKAKKSIMEQAGYSIKMAQGGKIDNIEDIKLKYAKKDIALLTKEGGIAITDTKHGVLWGEYENGVYSFNVQHKGVPESQNLFTGNKEDAIEFVKNSYQVEEMALGGKVGGRGFFGLKKGKRIMSPEELNVGDIILDHSDQFNADNTIKITDRRTYGTIVHVSGIYWNPVTNKRIGDEEFGVAPELGGSKYYFPESKNISKGNWEVSVGDIYQVGDMQYKIIKGYSKDKVEYLTKWATEKEWDPNSGGSLSINNFAVKGLFNDKTRIHPANKKSKKKK